MINIYKITNILNGKVYIGQTTKTLARRLSGHFADAKRYDHRFGRALMQHGFENFIIEKLQDGVIVKEVADKIETKYIREYKSTFPEYGYNVKEGGNCVPLPEESKIKISIKNKGRKVSDRELEVRRKKHTERYSPEKVEQLRINNRNAQLLLEKSTHIKVMHVQTGEIFKTINAAANKFNINRITLGWQIKNNKTTEFTKVSAL